MAAVRVKTVAQVQREDRRQTMIIVVLSAMCLSGFGYVIYDYVQITNRIVLPEQLSDVDAAVRQLEADGLVMSLDVPHARLVVSDAEWSELSHEEKVGLITQLARYCAEKNQAEFWALTVVGGSSRAILGELGLMGLNVN
ncbi:MAG: hypothetical protein L0Y80_06545 [Ignavibacteriae bacterium]|nr:hypothetical protein [Ignavibacteriota bacterium]